MKAVLKSPKTGEQKGVKVGWSWTLLFFSGFLGIPLFLRRLNIWGSIFLLLWVVSFIGPKTFSSIEGKDGISLMVLAIVSLCLQIFMAIKGNEMTAKNYLENGWEFVEPDSEITKIAKKRWGITV